MGGSWAAFGDIWGPLGPPLGQGIGEEVVNLAPGAPHEAQVNKIAITSLADWQTLTSNWTGYQTGRQATGDWIGTRTGNQ